MNGLGASASAPGTFYAASEWGGLFRSTDSGQRWAHVEGHVPTATWDVEVDPTNVNLVYATSFFDGRAVSRSGINVSTDGGVTWTHPATANPPANFCLTETRRTEPAAFGISIDPANATRVFVGTNCGLAMSTNNGATWNFVDPTPGDRATNIWDVVVHHGGIIDLCGDDGHLRSTDGGANWTTSTTAPLPSGGAPSRSRRTRRTFCSPPSGPRSSRPMTGSTGPARTPIRRLRAGSRSSRPISGRVPATICGSETSGCTVAPARRRTPRPREARSGATPRQGGPAPSRERSAGTTTRPISSSLRVSPSTPVP